MSEFDFSDRVRTARLAQAAAIALASFAEPAAAESLRAHYALTLLGLSFGSASASAMIEPQNYRLDISMKTSGLANLVNNTKAAATASGKLAPGGPAPAAFANTFANSYETRTTRMSLANNSVRALDVQPPPWDAAIRLPVSEEEKRHVVDPVSALIMSVPPDQPLVGPSACNRTIPVFDGVTRFNVELSYVDTRTAKTKGYVGPVSICSARYTPISGHSPNSTSTKFMAENHDMSVWLAPLSNAHVVAPLRIDVKTTVGMLSIDATEFQIGQK
ncbi:DUF3108 domain-containing protein [Methylocystis heyeri]|uniref:DUF3108 domain-containing protein n=1 Tax=Methylocystis heyeri TaxID=391905 RepID=A0A6B8KDG4_9HYPH|nr:DUF3108 domain-containing protein [Methylocystis heyeri]QGM46484.1 DUF3108 domain-containing protein [Methylocystis heyeri]